MCLKLQKWLLLQDLISQNDFISVQQNTKYRFTFHQTRLFSSQQTDVVISVMATVAPPNDYL